MGSYSQLYIGDLYLSWKYDIPNYLILLFEATNFYSKYDSTSNYIESIGYSTTAKKSLEILDRFNYNIPFFSEILSFFKNELQLKYSGSAQQKLIELHGIEDDYSIINGYLVEHLAEFPDISNEMQLRDFVKFIQVLYNIDNSQSPFTEPCEIKLQDGKIYKIDSKEFLRRSTYDKIKIIDFGELQYYAYDNALKYPPWILCICNLFDWSYMSNFPEILSLMFIRCALEAVPLDSEVKLDLVSITVNEKDVKSLHTDLAKNLVEKLNLYNRVFGILFQKEKDIRKRYIQNECKNLIANCDNETDKNRKGLALETLSELLFSENRNYDVIDKRVSTGDEEIDLVIKNNLTTPFWMAFNSPLILVECKNWVNKVGAKEIRNFEVKLQNHSNLTKIGVFISYNGFTSEAIEALKRSGRDNYHIVILEKADIIDFLNTDQNFYSWLEGKAARLI